MVSPVGAGGAWGAKGPVVPGLEIDDLRKVVPGGRLLVIRPAALGDTILALPALSLLRERTGPDGSLELLGSFEAGRLAVHPRGADRVHSIDRRPFGGLLGARPDAELDRFLSTFSLVVAWCHDRTAALASLTKRLGLALLRSDPFPQAGSGVHASDHLARSLVSLGIDRSAPYPSIALSSRAREAAARFLREARLERTPVVVIHPGSGSSVKNAPTELFAQLAERAWDGGAVPLLLEGEADENPVARLCARLSFPPTVARGLTIDVVAALVERSWGYAGNDSGVSHVAAAIGAPTLALFTTSDPQLWAPRGPRVTVLTCDLDADTIWAAWRRSWSAPAVGTTHP